jgi:hypothetical protein
MLYSGTTARAAGRVAMKSRGWVLLWSMLGGCAAEGRNTLTDADLAAEVEDAAARPADAADHPDAPGDGPDGGMDGDAAIGAVGDAASVVVGDAASGDAIAPQAPLEPQADLEFTSGSRLKAQFIESDDGLRYFTSFWDDQLDTICTFGRLTRNWADDAAQPIHCLPQEAGAIVYLDDGCTREALISHPSWGECRGSIFRIWTGSCQQEVVERGEQIEPDTYFLPDTITHACTPIPRTSIVQLHALKRRVAPSELVAAVERVRTGDGHLRAEYVRGADGSMARLGYHDTQWSSTCASSGDENGEPRCVPPHELFVPAGALCPAAIVSESCGASLGYDPIARVSGATFYRFEQPLAPDSCELAVPGDRLFGAVARVDPGMFAALEWTELGGSRLAMPWTSHPGLRPALPADFPGGYWERIRDKQLDLHCTPRLDVHGTERCLPYPQTGYLDAACTRPISQLPAETNGLRTGNFVVQETTPKTSCDEARYRVFRAGAPVPPGLAIYYRPEGKCNEVSTDVTGTDWYEAGEEAAPSTFVELSRVRH